MAVTFEILTDPIGSQFASTIGADDDDTLNDFTCFIVASNNTTGLTIDDLSVSEGEVISVEGENSVYRAVIRPPESAAVITFTIAADAVTEGSPETTQDIRVSTFFPDDDAETATQAFDPNLSGDIFGIAVTPTRIITCRGSLNSAGLDFFTHAGSEYSPKIGGFTGGTIDVLNGDVLSAGNRYSLSDFPEINIDEYQSSTRWGVCHTERGIVSVFANRLVVRPYGTGSSEEIEYPLSSLTPAAYNGLAHSQGLIYRASTIFSGTVTQSIFGLIDIIDDTEFSVRELNVDVNQTDISIYKDTLYITDGSEIYTLDIRPYRPMAKNTKTTIYPVFANEGDTIPLSQYAPDASDFIFDVGFDKPDYLSINASNELAIASNAVSETTPVLVQLRGINYIDSIGFHFYLIIETAAAPVWRDIGSLAMRADSSFDLFQIVGNADSIAVKSGHTNPSGSSLSGGDFTIGTAGGEVQFTATRGTLTSDIDFTVDVIQTPDPDNFSDTFDYRVEIGGIDVTNDVDEFPSVSKSLDAVAVNMYRVDEVNVTLTDAGGKYNPDIDDNFWTANSLNAGGFNETIKVYWENLISGSWVSHLLFSGLIVEQAEIISEVEARIIGVDIASRLERQNPTRFGNLTKWDALRQQSDEAENEGVYIPETALSPMQVGSGEAWRNSTELTISGLQLQGEGPPLTDTAYMTESDLRTSGGFLSDAPILKILAQHRAEDVKFLFNQLSINKWDLSDTS